MAQLAALKAATTLNQFAATLGFKPAWLTYILYILPEASKYKTFDIPKKSGGTRTICAPQGDLRLLQRRLADLLQNCIEDINRASAHSDDDDNPDRISHGFKRRRSIVTNAAQHRHRRYVFNADITDFFGSINFGRVRGFFISDKNFSLNPKVATLIAQIACFKNSLPQGSPCSPVVSNLIGHVLDIHLARLSALAGCTYTRYADDLTFSTNKKEFPAEIATVDRAGSHSWRAGNRLSHIIQMSGFSLNVAKSRMQYRASRQEVTGLVVNQHLNVRCEYRRTVRAMVHKLLRTGEFHFKRQVVDKLGVSTIEEIPGRTKQLGGMLGFIDQVDVLSAGRSKGLSKKTEMHRRFLLFDRFYRSSRPTLVCEGKTDNVYLTHAIRSLAATYPQLAQIHPDGKIDLKIARFRYTGKSTNRILGVNGGSSDLGHLIRLYRAEIERIAAPGMQWPLIVLIDNDSGAVSVYNTVKQLTGKKPTGSESHIHVVRNLYVVATPLFGSSTQSRIEDLFPKSTLEEKIGIKVFNPENNFDSDHEYGKSDFAYKIVQAKADSIDFSGFAPLLERIVGVLEAHQKMLGPAAP